ncbi:MULTISPECIES: hypothetical protein [unclassified Oceanispirochaeta]|uniref:hypothetical protein n=1 Tax=unclassified Oceanispirochaeta TaxID=2635722 RepID=UPI000E08E1F9|nr:MULTISPECIES: hypothetical protein [unclassified Oceanispirochaeta]MBF9017455.1 hypothetical protein [Oceanispirochaeta sp. M2]NPD74027.1 hypothetical protein [Oceanispirochaeta sp. M1]RDG30194.1 hypothetical protein DV872_18175 [Oceanispirochaeta sp. M1]
MNIKKLLEEYSLEIDDVRWHLSLVLTERLSALHHQPDEITKLVWSGELGDELYNMEEKYIKTLQDQIDEKTLDESHLRDILSQMDTARRKRFGY